MNIYLAPMEEVTGYVFRKVYSELFGNIDKYFTPFLTPTQKKILKTKDLKEVAKENNLGNKVVPQLLTNNSDHFIETIEFLMDLGYREFNLNCGCPAGTVFTKFKGSGMLSDLDRLDDFLESIFNYRDIKNHEFEISVKTRTGIEDHSQVEEILEVYNRYPLSELIVHPRTREQYYNGHADLEIFDTCVRKVKTKLCYNGDIFTVENYREIVSRFDSVDAVMIGRGIITNPGLVGEIKGAEPLSKTKLKEFHDRLYEEYKIALSSTKDALFKMKEVWFYLDGSFVINHEYEKYRKIIKKTDDDTAYSNAVKNIFSLQME